MLRLVPERALLQTLRMQDLQLFQSSAHRHENRPRDRLLSSVEISTLSADKTAGCPSLDLTAREGLILTRALACLKRESIVASDDTCGLLDHVLPVWVCLVQLNDGAGSECLPEGDPAGAEKRKNEWDTHVENKGNPNSRFPVFGGCYAPVALLTWKEKNIAPSPPMMPNMPSTNGR